MVFPVSETDPCSAGLGASNIYKKTLKRTQILETINVIGYQNIISPLFPRKTSQILLVS